jgi:hypothetical protein
VDMLGLLALEVDQAAARHKEPSDKVRRCCSALGELPLDLLARPPGSRLLCECTTSSRTVACHCLSHVLFKPQPDRCALPCRRLLRRRCSTVPLRVQPSRSCTPGGRAVASSATPASGGLYVCLSPPRVPYPCPCP